METQTDGSTPAERRAHFTKLAARGYTQIRHILVQLPDTEPKRASVVGDMVHERKHHSLLLYILLLTTWPWLHDRDNPLEGKTWVEALSAEDVPDSPGALTWSPSTLSRTWADLEKRGLVVTKREGRALRVTPRREDGKADYEFPKGRRDRWNAYFSLPDAFWNDGWFAKLSLPALAMLLVVAKETNGKKHETWLTYDNCEAWYGIRRKSVQKGTTELIAAGLLHLRAETVKAPLSATGKTTRSWYSLTGDFGRTARAAQQTLAAAETKKRRKAEASPHA